MLPNRVLLSTAYFAPIEYFAVLDNCSDTIIEACEQYQKQSYRTRCHILTGSGILVLTLPVLRAGVAPADGETVSEAARAVASETAPEATHKLPVSNVKIDYSKPWVLQHKRAIEAAYGNSPFFEYYKDEIFALLDSHIETLLDLNTELTTLLCELCGIRKKFSLSSRFVKPQETETDTLDLRSAIHPKVSGHNNPFYKEKAYYQVFTNKYGFTPNLSILDLLFNEGPNSVSFL